MVFVPSIHNGTERAMTRSGLPRRDIIKAGVSAGLMGPCVLTISAEADPTHRRRPEPDHLGDSFQTPPSPAKPHTLWHWMDGNISKEGITADLEAMHRIGLGGAMMYSLSYQVPQGPVRYASSAWREMVAHAAKEADRLGLELGMHNASGWSSTGGPWITPDLAMQSVVWSETRVSGPGPFAGTLTKPEAGKFGDYYRDIVVLACRTPEAERQSLESANVRISTSLPNDQPRQFRGRTDHLKLVFETPSEKAQYITLSFDRPFTARGLCIKSEAGHGPVTCTVETSDDGTRYQSAACFVLPRRGMPNIAFDPVTARFFRLSFTGEVQDRLPFTVSRIDLLAGYRLPDFNAKAGFALMDRFMPHWRANCPPDEVYHHANIIDISDRLRADGTLDWAVPDGEWTVLRFGYAPNGATSMHPEPGGDGLEVDKMSPAALDVHFSAFIDAVMKDVGPLAGKSLTTLLVDSYEVGPQNWTGQFREQFRRRCGYDIAPFMPVLTGRVVDSAETTERVLWDFRRTIASLFVENYYGHFQTRCRERGLKFASEPYIGPFSIIDASTTSDLALGEFWSGNLFPENISLARRVTAGSRLRGRAIAGAEAFTSRFDIDRYTLDPAAMKTTGDAQFCEGITRFYFHRFAHQPWLDKAPGMMMGPYGLHFDRTQTWWEPGSAWIQYITRCQQLLQQGSPVADILCFDGEDGQVQSHWNGKTLPDVPEGYNYDFVNRDYLQTAEVRDGAIVLSNGARYHLLALPDARHYTLPVVRKLAALAKAGALILGAPPTRSPSYSDFGDGDRELANLVAELWGGCDGKHVTSHRVGNGAVYWGETIGDVLTALRLAPDFAATEKSAHLRFAHRTTADAHIYFISNQSDREISTTCAFRVTGKTPEIWDPETGRRGGAPLYRMQTGTTEVALTLPPTGSLFVVFRKPLARRPAAVASNLAPNQITPTRDGFVATARTAGCYQITLADGHQLRASVPAPPPPIGVNDQWAVTFPPNRGAPASVLLDRLQSLSENFDAGVRYFSGTARYSRAIEIPALSPDIEIWLDLGEVKNLARIFINGHDLGVMWKPPFHLPITSAVRPGKNKIEVEVTNLWPNRLIGDEQLPDDCDWKPVPERGMYLKAWPQWMLDHQPRPTQRVSFATWKFYDKEAPLLRSGLIGPASIRFARKIHFKL